MQPTLIDFETFYSKEFSLTKMSTIEYVSDPRFEPLLLSVLDPEKEKLEVFEGDEIDEWIDSFPWHKRAVGAHNMAFDGAVLFWHYGVQPRLYVDTLSMARATMREHTWKFSLAELARAVGLPGKGEAISMAMGKRRGDFSRHEWKQYKSYCGRDNYLANALYNLMRENFPRNEMAVIDCVIRMAVEPGFRVNVPLLEEYWSELEGRRDDLLAQFGGIDARWFRSANQFAALLRTLGLPEYDIPRKISPRTGKQTFAFAKSDRNFKELLDHPDKKIQAAVETRLNVSSNIEQTRAQRLINLGRTFDQITLPQAYYGAHTGRFTGRENINPHNFPNFGALRNSLEAPDGYTVVVGDASQIEARLNAVVSGEEELVEAFAEGRDVYAEFAEIIYEKKISKETHKTERNVGKVGILSLGYYSGAATLRQMLWSSASPIDLRLTECERIVNLYRRTYRNIKDTWHEFHQLIPDLAMGTANAKFPCGVHFLNDRIILPSGFALVYPNLRQEQRVDAQGKHLDGRKWVYDQGKLTRDLYGGKVCIAEGEQVLTDHGWRAIQTVLPHMKVFDGVEFVEHTGVVCNGRRECIEYDGIAMTPDHLVLDHEGNWQQAVEAARPYRPDLRNADGYKTSGDDWQEASLGIPAPALAGLCGFQSRHGALVEAGVDAGTDRQRWPLFAGQLPMGDVQGAGAQPPRVYDITNCGPRKRYVLYGAGGPVIAHNCENIIQALAACFIREAMAWLHMRGWKIVLQVHDEIILLVKTEDVDRAREALRTALTTPPKWAPGLPLDCETGAGPSYGAAK